MSTTMNPMTLHGGGIGTDLNDGREIQNLRELGNAVGPIRTVILAEADDWGPDGKLVQKEFRYAGKPAWDYVSREPDGRPYWGEQCEVREDHGPDNDDSDMAAAAINGFSGPGYAPVCPAHLIAARRDLNPLVWIMVDVDLETFEQLVLEGALVFRGVVPPLDMKTNPWSRPSTETDY
jgi:hypothetical protein